MGHDTWSFFGMHLFWWLFWIAIVVAFLALFMPAQWRHPRETPLEELQRRYAAGALSSQDYEEHKAALRRDRVGRDNSRNKS